MGRRDPEHPVYSYAVALLHDDSGMIGSSFADAGIHPRELNYKRAELLLRFADFKKIV